MSSVPSMLFPSRTQGLFSLQTAFNNPKLNKTLSSTFINQNQSTSSFYPKTHPTVLQVSNTQQCQAIASKESQEDPDYVIYEPTKKVKLGRDQYKTQSNKSYQLTVDEVFNTRKGSKNNCFFDDESNEGSSLSFLSSCSSLDLETMEEEEVKEANEIEYKNSSNQHKKEKRISSEAFVNNNLAQRVASANQPDFFSVYELNKSMTFPTSQSNSYYNDALLKNLHQQRQALMNLGNLPNVYGYPLQFYQPTFAKHPMAPLNFNAYAQAPNYTEEMTQRNLILEALLAHEQKYADHGTHQLEPMIVGKIGYMHEDGSESEFCATRSTSVDQENSNEVSESPFYEKIRKESGLLHMLLQGDSSPERKTRENKKSSKEKKRAEKKIRQRKPASPTAPKEKKTRALNLDININPKHLKVERRRLNRLQLLRYQQEGGEEGIDFPNKINENYLADETTVVEQTATETQVDFFKGPEFTVTVPYETLQAEIPPFADATYARRNICKPVWNPEHEESEIIEIFMQELSNIVEFQVTDEAAAIKILKSFDMDISSALESVQENKFSYAETLRIKKKKVVRRRF